MICLPSTDKLQIKLGAGHTTSALQYSVTYAKKSTGAVASGRGSSDGTNDVDVVPAPTSGDYHLVKQLTVYNADTVAQTVTVKIDVSGTDYVLWKGSVAVGATLFYSPESGFAAVASVTNANFLASVGSAVNDVTGDGTLYTVIFGSEIFDSGSNYNPSTGTFTAPVTGRYRLSTSVALTDCGSTFTFGLHIVTTNRTYYTYDYVSDTNSVRQIHGNTLADMGTGDTAVVKIVASGGTKIVNVYGDGNQNTWFCGEWVGG